MTKIQLFLERIGLPNDTKIEKTLDFLKTVHYACVTTIAYENLDILKGIPLSLEPEDIFEKIVIRKRGGYCFEKWDSPSAIILLDLCAEKKRSPCADTEF